MLTYSVKLDQPLVDATVVSGSGHAPVSIPSELPPLTPIQESSEPQQDAQSSQEQKILLDGICSKLDVLEGQAVELRRAMQQFSVQLAAKIVRHVVSESSELQQERLKALVQKATGDSDLQVEIFVNPAEVDWLVECFNNDSDSDRKPAIRSDEEVAPGECRVAHAEFENLSDLNRQMSDIENRLLEAIRNE